MSALLTLLLMILKWAGVFTADWLWVVSPLWIGMLLVSVAVWTKCLLLVNPHQLRRT